MTKKKGLEINDNRAFFTMKLKGGNLPEDFEAVIETIIDFTGASVSDLQKVCASGQSARVALQSQLRKKSVQELVNMGTNGLTIAFDDIYAGTITKPIDKIMALGREEFIDLMVDQLDMTMDQASTLYNKKHGIETETE